MMIFTAYTTPGYSGCVQKVPGMTAQINIALVMLDVV
jgi:hypothetical protein